MSDFGPVAVFAIVLAGLLAYFFQDKIIPRGLSGLQVAFPTGAKRYEVHTVTSSKEDAKQLLKTPGMRNGLTVYVMALSGAILRCGLCGSVQWRASGSVLRKPPCMLDFALVFPEPLPW